MKKNCNFIVKKQCERATKVFPPAQGKKWAELAAILWYSHFRQCKVDENVWSLYWFFLEWIKAMTWFLGPPGGSGHSKINTKGPHRKLFRKVLSPFFGYQVFWHFQNMKSIHSLMAYYVLPNRNAKKQGIFCLFWCYFGAKIVNFIIC